MPKLNTIVLLLLSVGLAAAKEIVSTQAPILEAYSDGLNRWTPQVSAQLREFFSREGEEWGHPGQGSDAIVPSGNGKFFFFISRHGDLVDDSRHYILTVFATADVLQTLRSEATKPPLPLCVLERVHDTKAIAGIAGIGDAYWLSDNVHIEFRGTIGPSDQTSQIFNLNVVSGELKALTEINDSPGSVSIGRLGKWKRFGSTVIYQVYTYKSEDKPADYPIYHLSASRLADLVENPKPPGYVTVKRSSGIQIYVARDGKADWKMPADLTCAFGAWPSPDGNRLILLQRVDETPPTWGQYVGATEMSRRSFLGGSRSPLFRYVLVDPDQKKVQPLFDAPIGVNPVSGVASDTTAFWSSDGETVVFVGQVSPRERHIEKVVDTGQPVADWSSVVSYEISTGQWNVLEMQHSASGRVVKDVSERVPGTELLVRHERGGLPDTATVYTYRNSRWEPRSADAALEPLKPRRPALAGGLVVQLRQSANEPPRIVASLDDREITLTSPDPALAGIGLAHTDEIQWTDSYGITHPAALIMPRELPLGEERIPLVIQIIDEYRPGEFHPDNCGGSTTAFAAQTLAARNMAVLTVDMRGRGGDAAKAAAELESVAAKIARDHPIDLDRIGVVGFSATGYIARYWITHHPHLVPAAAVIAASSTSSFLGYLESVAVDRGHDVHSHELRNGGHSFYDAKQEWLQRDLSFNIDRVQTPVLFVQNWEATCDSIDTVGGFKATSKPFDFLIIPDGNHYLFRPRQREASYEATADWMSFWLQGKEYPCADDPDRYKRWRKQRELQGKNQHANLKAPASANTVQAAGTPNTANE